MKKLLVLAGGSKRNQVWGESCVEHFDNQFDNVFFIHYDHWATEEKNINFEAELEKIKKIVEEDGVGEGSEWFIFCKIYRYDFSFKSCYRRCYPANEMCLFWNATKYCG